MNSSRIYYRRNLPHYQPPGYAFFITFRLFGTLPAEVVKRLKELKQERLKQIAGYETVTVKNEKYSELKSKYFKFYDDYLDKASAGSTWLKDPKIAGIVKDAIHFRDGKDYDLIAYTIMPNHVHLVFIPIVKQPVRRSLRLTGEGGIADSLNTKGERNGVSLYIVTKTLQGLKKYTSRECNKLLNRNGSFWQHESYDHVIRDSKALKRIVDYVLNNPVKAGLAKSREEWKHRYVNYNFIPEL